MKTFKILKRERRWLFALALFVLVFATASAIKVIAAGNIAGWLWGGGADNFTNVRWISMNSDNTGIGSYGVSMPDDDGAVTGYAWGGGDESGPGLGWIDFNPQDHCTTGIPDFSRQQYKAKSCTPPSGSPGVFRSGNSLIGWARFVDIAKESEIGNSGGWDGWLKMYNVTVDEKGKLDGYAWNGENASEGLGWIDFSRAGIPVLPACATKTICDGSKFTTCDASFCVSGTCSLTGDTTWDCVNVSGVKKSCEALVLQPDIGQCGSANGANFCGKEAPTENLCAKGTASSVSAGYSEYTWTCGSSTCGGTQVNCSASGVRCGWIETNP